VQWHVPLRLAVCALPTRIDWVGLGDVDVTRRRTPGTDYTGARPTRRESSGRLHPIVRLQRDAGNAAIAGLFAAPGSVQLQRVTALVVQRANAVVSGKGMVGDTPGPMVNAAADVRLALTRLIHLHSITVPDHDTVAAALTKRDQDIGALPAAERPAAANAPVDVAVLGPLVAALARNTEGSINPAVTQSQLGVRIDAPVGPGLSNATADVDALAAVLQFEGLATSVTADPASKLPAVIDGLRELKNRILTGVRPEGPRFSGVLPTARVAEGVVQNWPRLLAAPDTSAQVKADLYKQIGDNRSRIPVRPGVGPAFGSTVPAPYHQGIAYTRSKQLLRAGAEPRPTNLTEGSAGRTAANNAAWDELLTEGSAGSANAFDSQLMTVGRGFGVSGGQGAQVLRDFFTADPVAMSALLHVGFTVDGTTPVAADPGGQRLLRGDAALRHIELNRGVYSQLANTAESSTHIGQMTNAQFGVMRRQAADIPPEVFEGPAAWNMDVMRFAVHLKHFASGFTWTHMVQHGTGPDGRGNINKLAAMILPQLSSPTAHGAGTLWPGEENRMLEWGEHIVGKQLTRIAALPNAATVPAGTRYFTVSGGFKVWPAGILLASA
jgi:hypothetical protein